MVGDRQNAGMDEGILDLRFLIFDLKSFSPLPIENQKSEIKNLKHAEARQDRYIKFTRRLRRACD
jgi:hypothetical protein